MSIRLPSVIVCSACLWVFLAAAARAQDLITVPFLKTAPAIDGKIEAREWQFAAATTGLVDYHTGRVVDLQPIVYLGYDEQNLYIAMRSWGNHLRAQCVHADSPEISTDDTVELMVAAGQGADFKRPEFATYHAILNSIGTLFDVYYLHNRAENHPEWSLGGQIAQKTAGGVWSVEMRIPFAAFGSKKPSDDAIWSFNIARVCDARIALGSASSAIIRPENGISIRFDRSAPAVRLFSLERTMQSKAGLSVEVANGTDRATELSADFLLSAGGEHRDKKAVWVSPGEVTDVRLGGDATYSRDYAELTWSVGGPSGQLYAAQRRNIHYPVALVSPVRGEAEKEPPFYFYPRYYPSLDRLVVEANFSQFAQREAVKTAVMSVYADERMTKCVMTATAAIDKKSTAVIRRDASQLADGKYYVKGTLLDAKSSPLATAHDWFVKARPEWLIHKRGMGDKVLAPFTPLRTQPQEVDCWGRRYRFGKNGLLEQLVTADAPILAAPVTLTASSQGKPVTWNIAKPFRFGQVADQLVSFVAALEGAGLDVVLEGSVEYDGLLMMKLSYGPKQGQSPWLDSLQLEIPIRQENAQLYIAHPDSVYGLRCGELSQKNGIILNSKDDLRNQRIVGTFTPYLWVGDMDRGFCWAAESDQGWITDDAKACLEVERRDRDVVLRFHFVGKPSQIDRTRTIVFGLQASPVKPIANKWRGVWGEGLFAKGEVPVIFRLLGGNPPGSTSMHWTLPDPDPKQQERGHKRLWGSGFQLDPNLNVVSGYYSWWGLARGEIGSFRGEWVPSKAQWDTPEADWSKDPRSGVETNVWGPYAWGKDPENYRWVNIVRPPSFVDFNVWSLEHAAKAWNLSGFYGDCSYMQPMYDEDLGLGYIRDDGRQQACVPIFSVYRAAWKRSAYVLDSLGRDNYLCPWSNYNALPAAAWGGALVIGEQESLMAKSDDFADLFGSLPRFSTMFVGRQFGLPSMSCQMTGKAAEKGQGRQAMMLYCLHDINPLWVPYQITDEYRGPARGKARFKPWEPDVKFHGYWQPGQALKVEGDGVKVSYYTAKDRVMFMVGNLSKAAVTAVLRPDWARLGVAPQRLFDAETDAPVKMSDGTIRVTLPPRGLHLIVGSASDKPV